MREKSSVDEKGLNSVSISLDSPAVGEPGIPERSAERFTVMRMRRLTPLSASYHTRALEKLHVLVPVESLVSSSCYLSTVLQVTVELLMSLFVAASSRLAFDTAPAR